ncbi:WSC domain-containing protein 1 [Mactra antiquata]
MAMLKKLLMWILVLTCVVFLLQTFIRFHGDKFVKLSELYFDTNNQDRINGNGSMMTSQFGCKRNVGFLKSPKPFVALASFHGSGNTWTRELLEDLTGIYTGSLYLDPHFNMTGSGRCPLLGEVYIIKTHQAKDDITSSTCEPSLMKNLTIYDKAIFILRNPFDAFVAEFNRRKGGGKHSGLAKQEHFKSKGWENYVKGALKRWRKTILYWITAFDKPRHILVYEKLIENQRDELTKLADFLQVDDATQNINCMMSEVKDRNKREKPDWLKKENLFNDELRESINAVLEQLLQNDEMELVHKTIQGYLYK